jgi:hypothetical protein
MKYPLKLIEWQDSYNGDHDWFSAKDLVCKPILVQTIGFEVLRTDTHVTLAMSAHDDRLCDTFTIPLGMIVREQTFRSRLTQEKKDG